MQTQKVIDYISNWLFEYCENSGTKGFVIGISGGIDSALTSTLAAKTGLSLLCLEMPIHQSKEQVKRASNHIDWLTDQYANVERKEIDLTDPFEKLLDALPNEGPGEKRDLSLANTRARLRMTVLYYFAGLNNLLVVGTGNKVEDFGVGFFTKYGDGGVDISPIADLFKSEVYDLAKHLGVNEEILKAPPTDGLWGDNRTDEDQIGASYEELEWAMRVQSITTDEKKYSNREKDVLKIYRMMNRANQHKMLPIPICKIPKELK